MVPSRISTWLHGALSRVPQTTTLTIITELQAYLQQLQSNTSVLLHQKPASSTIFAMQYPEETSVNVIAYEDQVENLIIQEREAENVIIVGGQVENIRLNGHLYLPPAHDATDMVLHTMWPPPSPPPPDTPAHSRESMLAEHRYAYQAIRDTIARHPEAPESPGAAWFSRCKRLDLLEAIQLGSEWLKRNISQQHEPIRQRRFARVHENVHSNMAWEWNENAWRWRGFRNVKWTVVRDNVVYNENPWKAMTFFELPQTELCGVCAWLLAEVRSFMNEAEARAIERRRVEEKRAAEARQARAACGRAERVKRGAERCCQIL